MRQFRSCLVVLFCGIVLILIVGKLVEIHCSHEIEKSTNAVARQQIDISDDQLIRAVMKQMWERYRECRSEGDMLSRMSKQEKSVYCVGCYYMEMDREGMLKYLLDCQNTAPYLTDSLAEVKADAYREMFYDFVHNNKIDVYDLKEFSAYTREEYDELYDKYPFEQFEKKYENLMEKDSLKSYLGNYIRESIAEL